MLRAALAIVSRHRRAYLRINAVYYGLVVLGMVLVATQPEVQEALIASTAAGFSSGPLSLVGEAYGGGQVLQAAAITFAVNLVIGTIAYIGVPSLVVPFAGLVTGCFRALLWGLLLSPANPDLRWVMIPHSVTLLLEGQAYIMAMFAAYVLWTTVLHPDAPGLTVARRYALGLGRGLRLYLLVVLLLAVAALYEAFELIVLLR
ncbi:MAG: hypothetical protein ACYC5O_12420 [Anaerolineae bacterium]